MTAPDEVFASYVCDSCEREASTTILTKFDGTFWVCDNEQCAADLVGGLSWREVSFHPIWDTP